MTSSHCKLSPSGSKIWLTCPGSAQLSASIDFDKSTPHSEEGTLAHAYAEYRLRNLFGEVVTWKSVVTDDIKAAVQVYIDLVLQVVTPLDTHGSNKTYFIERKLSLPTPHKFTVWGTADFCFVDREKHRLTIIDYKHGVGVPVEAKKNTQLLIYALAAMAEIKHDFKKIELIVVQPRSFSNEESVSRWECAVKWISDWKRDVFNHGVENALAENPNLISGEHCQFCYGKAVCPELYETNTDLVGIKVVDQSAEKIDPKRVFDVAEKAPQIRAWLNAVEIYLAHLIDTGNGMKGVKLVPKAGRRHWLPGAEEKLIELLGSSTIYEDKKIKSISGIERLLKYRGFDKKSIEAFWEKKPSSQMKLIFEKPEVNEFKLLEEKNG